MTTYIIAIALLLICSAFFSGSETGLTAVSRARLFQRIKQGDARAQVAFDLRQEKESLIGAILLGNNAVNILASALATSVGIEIWGQELGVVWTTIIMTLLVLIFAEVLPKTYAIQHSERVALLVARPIKFAVWLFHPITVLVKGLTLGLLRMAGAYDAHGGSGLLSTADMLRGTIDLQHREGNMLKLDRDMLGSILDLGEVEVQSVMIHRTQVEGIDLADGVAAAIDKAVASAYSRLPLYEQDGDQILGVLHVKKLLRLLRDKGDAHVTREDLLRVAVRPWFVPASTLLKDQLLAFRQKRQHFAMVVDEYGALLGVVTLEDIIEEIVGEIDDEHDAVGLLDVVPLRGGAFLVEGDVPIRDLNRQLDWQLPDENATTIAGLCIHEARDIPEPGQEMELYGIKVRVEAREANLITRLRLEPIGAESDS